MKNRITELFNIQYPIIQAGMIWCSGWRLAAAVSNAGGLGIIGAGSMYPDVLRDHIQKCKAATKNNFGVNLPLLYPNINEHIAIIIEEKVPIVFTSAGNPATWTSHLKSHGIKVVHVIANTKFALKAEAAGVDAIVAEVLESWSEKKLEEKRGNSRETVQYVCRDWQISELTDLVNELNEHAIEHEWVGHHLRVFIEDELTVDEIIGELSLNPNFALNSFEEFKNDDSGKYSDKTSWRKHFTFPFFTIPQFVNLENELAEEDITHFWKDQILHITEGDIGVVKTIIEEDFGIIEEPS